MRFSLIDLLMASVIGGVGTALGSYVLGHEPQRKLEPLAILVGVIACFAVLPPIYRRLHMRPLWYPKCPSCKDKNRWYHFAEPLPRWPRDRIVCATCQTEIDLWYEPPTETEVSITTPSFQLLWPQSWGRWRSLTKQLGSPLPSK